MFLVLVGAGTALLSPVHAQALDENEKMSSNGLTREELAAEPPPPPPARQPQFTAPVMAEAATDVRLEVSAEFGYVDEFGRYVVDLLEQDYAYLSVQLTTPDGRPVMGAAPAFSVAGTSRLLEPQALSKRMTSDEFGVIEFAVMGGRMGLDRVRIEVGQTR